MKADNDTKFAGFSMLFGALLFAVCIIYACDHSHVRHQSRLAVERTERK